MTIEIIFYLFGFLSVLLGVFAALSTSIKNAAFYLWLCGLSLGVTFLVAMSEFVALAQWLVSSLIYLTFVFHTQKSEDASFLSDWVKQGLSGFIGFLFILGLYFGLKDSVSRIRLGDDLISVYELGHYILSDQLLSVEVLSLSFFLVVVGIGVLGKRKDSK